MDVRNRLQANKRNPDALKKFLELLQQTLGFRQNCSRAEFSMMLEVSMGELPKLRTLSAD